MKKQRAHTAHWANQLILLTGLLFCMASVHAQAPAPATLRAEVHKPLTAAQEAMKSNQMDQALSFTREALAVSQLTPVERAFVMRTQAAAAVRAKNWDLAIESLEFLVTSPDVPQTDKRSMLESLMNACLQKKDNTRAVKWGRQYLQDGGTNPGIRLAMIQTLSVMGEHKQVLQEVQEKMRLDAAAGQKTPEQELRLMAISYRQLKDDAGYMSTLKRLVNDYPTKAYWVEVIGRMSQQPGLNPRQELNLYRLLEQTGNMEEVDEYIEMANLAIKAGLPAEALRVLSKGLDQGVLGKGADATLHNKLRADAQKKTQEDAKGFAPLEKSAKDAVTWAAVADVYFSQQNWTAAHAAYAKSLELGGSKRENELRLHAAISLFQLSQKDGARQQLANIKGDVVWTDMAALWGILAR
jgi:tetratricopeptide (TPR) repeat protein